MADLIDRLDTFNSILLRHPSQNPHLLYLMLRSHVLFEDLGTFTLARALRDIKRREEEERNKNQTHPTKGKSPTRGDGAAGQQAHEEKARLLAAEGVEPHSIGGDVDIPGDNVSASLGNMGSRLLLLLVQPAGEGRMLLVPVTVNRISRRKPEER
jgi:hypothetical protein